MTTAISVKNLGKQYQIGAAETKFRYNMLRDVLMDTVYAPVRLAKALIGKSDRRVVGRFLRQLQALCTYEHLMVPEAQRNEKLVDLTIVATWHVLDGIHRLSDRHPSRK